MCLCVSMAAVKAGRVTRFIVMLAILVALVVVMASTGKVVADAQIVAESMSIADFVNLILDMKKSGVHAVQIVEETSYIEESAFSKPFMKESSDTFCVDWMATCEQHCSSRSEFVTESFCSGNEKENSVQCICSDVNGSRNVMYQGSSELVVRPAGGAFNLSYFVGELMGAVRDIPSRILGAGQEANVNTPFGQVEMLDQSLSGNGVPVSINVISTSVDEYKLEPNGSEGSHIISCVVHSALLSCFLVAVIFCIATLLWNYNEDEHEGEEEEEEDEDDDVDMEEIEGHKECKADEGLVTIVIPSSRMEAERVPLLFAEEEIPHGDIQVVSVEDIVNERQSRVEV